MGGGKVTELTISILPQAHMFACAHTTQRAQGNARKGKLFLKAQTTAVGKHTAAGTEYIRDCWCTG